MLGLHCLDQPQSALDFRIGRLTLHGAAQGQSHLSRQTRSASPEQVFRKDLRLLLQEGAIQHSQGLRRLRCGKSHRATVVGIRSIEGRQDRRHQRSLDVNEDAAAILIGRRRLSPTFSRTRLPRQHFLGNLDEDARAEYVPRVKLPLTARIESRTSSADNRRMLNRQNSCSPDPFPRRPGCRAMTSDTCWKA